MRVQSKKLEILYKARSVRNVMFGAVIGLISVLIASGIKKYNLNLIIVISVIVSGFMVSCICEVFFKNKCDKKSPNINEEDIEPVDVESKPVE